MSLPVVIDQTAVDDETIPFNRVENIKHDSAMGELYATQLLSLWDEHLDQQLSAVNPKAAARFRTLMCEIRSATGRVSMQLERMGGGS